MRKILYLLKDTEPAHADLIPGSPPSESEVSVILLQDGVTMTLPGVSRVYALSDDVVTRTVTTSYPLVSYADMLRLIFDSDVVVAL